jgi:hypothetical protein
MSRKTADDFWPKLEKLGEEEVRKRVADGVWDPNDYPVIAEWLRRQEENRKRISKDQEESRQNKALSVASSGRTAAWVAAIAAAIAAIVSIILLIKN